MRTCLTCDLCSRENGVLLCKSTHPDMLGVGCGCYLPYTAMWANPYPPGGCYGRSLDPDLGWPAYEFKDCGERLANVLDFILHPPDKHARTIQPQGRPGLI